MVTFDPLCLFDLPETTGPAFSADSAASLERLLNAAAKGEIVLILRDSRPQNDGTLTEERIAEGLRQILAGPIQTHIWLLMENAWAISLCFPGGSDDPIHALTVRSLQKQLPERLRAAKQEISRADAALPDSGEASDEDEATPDGVPSSATETVEPEIELIPLARLPMPQDIQGHLAELNALLEIIVNKQMHAQFQPIVNLQDGRIFGYEALIRGPKGNLLRRLGQMFTTADQAHMVAWLDVACQEQCFARAAQLGIRQALFVNMDAEGLSYLELYDRSLAASAREHGLCPSQVVIEICERQTMKDFPRLLQYVESLREQGFRIALDDVGAGYSSLNAIAELRPDFIKIDRDLVRHMETKGARRALVAALVQYAHHIGTTVLAEGAETREELAALIELGVTLGQGYVMGKPADDLRGVPRQMREFIIERQRLKRLATTGRQAAVGDIARRGVTVAPETPLTEAVRRFTKDDGLTSIVVMAEETVQGIVLRDQLAHILDAAEAAEIAFLPADQTIAVWMQTNLMFVDAARSVAEVAHQVTTRSDISLDGDLIVVGPENRYVGVLPIRALLEAAHDASSHRLRHADPLTGLPNRVGLEQELHERIAARAPLAILRADIRGLSAYNRAFGVARGDGIVTALADLMRQVAHTHEDTQPFLAHLGGGDFVLLTRPETAGAICSALLKGFGARVSGFFTPEQVRQGYFETETRPEQKQRVPLCSLSIAVLTNAKRPLPHCEQALRSLNDLLRAVKSLPGSGYAIDRAPDRPPSAAPRS